MPVESYELVRLESYAMFIKGDYTQYKVEGAGYHFIDLYGISG